MENEVKIVMIDENKNKSYIREIMFKGKKEIIIIPTSNEDIAVFDKVFAEVLITYLNSDEKSKLKFSIEE